VSNNHLKSRYGDAYVFVLLNINAKAQVKKIGILISDSLTPLILQAVEKYFRGSRYKARTGEKAQFMCDK